MYYFTNSKILIEINFGFIYYILSIINKYLLLIIMYINIISKIFDSYYILVLLTKLLPRKYLLL